MWLPKGNAATGRMDPVSDWIVPRRLSPNPHWGPAQSTCANQISVGGEVAVFERVRNLWFINRFGEEVVRPRRCYRYRTAAERGAAGSEAGAGCVLRILTADDVPDLHAGR